MSKGHSYFELLDAFKGSGCPICTLVLKDSRRYLDHLLYESVLDVPIRVELIDSFGFCSWHTWQIPSLPPICSPSTGYAIFASDLLRKFNGLAQEITIKLKEKRGLKSLLTKISRGSPHIKDKVCPACHHVAQFESYHLNALADSIGDEQFLEAYRASQGICLPHFFLLEKNYPNHPNFPLLLDLQTAKSGSLRTTLEEFIRKQDHRFQKEITQAEAKAWKVAMEFVAGKPGVFTNEMGHGLLQKSRKEKISPEKISLALAPFDKLTFEQLIDEVKTSKEITLYLKQPLPPFLFKELRELNSREVHPMIEAVVEDLSDSKYLGSLHSAGFFVFYGLGLPSQSVIFLGRNRGFLLEGDGLRLRPFRQAEDLYFKLLWRRFGNAVLLSGLVKEKDIKSGLFCLATEGGRERWCRFRDQDLTKGPPVGTRVEVFAWEKWGTQVLEVLQVTVLKDGETSPLNLQEAKEGGK